MTCTARHHVASLNTAVRTDRFPGAIVGGFGKYILYIPREVNEIEQFMTFYVSLSIPDY